ncbi:hypothetical protein T439DRAFT_324955 [Meredithblackwellia eburnea MCA 4105]
MLHRSVSFLAFSLALLISYVTTVQAVDNRILVNTLNAFCTEWENQCIAIAHRSGKAVASCQQGYGPNGTALVNCYSYVGTDSKNFNDQVVAAMNATKATL